MSGPNHRSALPSRAAMPVGAAVGTATPCAGTGTTGTPEQIGAVVRGELVDRRVERLPKLSIKSV